MRYDRDRDHIEMSVRELCELALLSGDIDCRRGTDDPYERAALGREIHKKLQNSFGSLYHGEVELHNEIRLDEVTFYVKGRADGIICHSNRAELRGACQRCPRKISSRPQSLFRQPCNDRYDILCRRRDP